MDNTINKDRISELEEILLNTTGRLDFYCRSADANLANELGTAKSAIENWLKAVIEYRSLTDLSNDDFISKIMKMFPEYKG